MEAINNIKQELKNRYNVLVKCSELQGGCIGIKHDEQDTIKVRYVAKKILGFTLLTNEKYHSAFYRKSTANTIVY